MTHNSDYGGYHPGEDWNGDQGGSSDVGDPVYAIANGVVTAITSNVDGEGIVIEHTLHNGESIYSVYIHIAIKHGLSVGSVVHQGKPIGTIADITWPHLHFEIRTKPVNTRDWYPKNRGNGYYASREALYADGFTVNPSDFIDSNRGEVGLLVEQMMKSKQVMLTLYVHDGSADGPMLSGAKVTGQDAAGSSFYKTTDSNGLVGITGSPGTWQFTVTKPGYAANSWSQEIRTTCTKHAYLFIEELTVEVEADLSTSQDLMSSSEIGDAAAVDPLIEALGDDEWKIRQMAVSALCDIGETAVDPLILALGDSNSDVRGGAAGVLGNIGSPSQGLGTSDCFNSISTWFSAWNKLSLNLNSLLYTVGTVLVLLFGISLIWRNLWVFIVNGVSGLGLIYLFSTYLGIWINVTTMTLLVCVIGGIPGAILLIVLQYFYGISF